MRPAFIIIIILVVMTGGLFSCTSQQTTTPAGSISPVSSTPTIPVDSSPEITTQVPVTSNIPVSTNAVISETTTPSVIVTTPSPTETTATTVPGSSNLKVVGYVTHWHLNKLPSIKLKGLTHLIWQGIEVTSSSDPTLVVASNAGWWQITDVVTAGHNNGAKVLVSLIGEWGQSSLTDVWNSPKLRTQLIKNLTDMVNSYDLDGIDIDNENNNCDANLYSTFIKELYDAISPLGKTITIAGSPYGVCINSSVYSDIDFVNVMTYDMAVPDHSTYDDSVRAMELWASAGVPKEKLLIGIPFYGRDGDVTSYEYWWIVNKYKPTPDQNQVMEPKASGGIIWWNGPELAKEKVQYVKDNGYGGVMMYELGEDSQDGSSLLQSVYDAVQQQGESASINKSNNVYKSPLVASIISCN